MNPRVHAAWQSCHLKVAALEYDNMGYRIDDAERIRRRDEKLDGRSIIARAAREGTALLLGPRADWITRNSDRPWAPAGGWNEEWLPGGLAWYDQDARESESWWDGPAAQRHLGGAA